MEASACGFRSREVLAERRSYRPVKKSRHLNRIAMGSQGTHNALPGLEEVG